MMETTTQVMAVVSYVYPKLATSAQEEPTPIQILAQKSVETD